MGKKLLRLLIIIFLSLALCACSNALIYPVQPLRDGSVSLTQKQAVGQTFTSEYNGLRGISIYVEKIENGDGEIVLHLRKNPIEDIDLRNCQLPFQRITSPGYYSFEFPVLSDSSHSDYYFLLELHGSGSLAIGTSNQSNYLNGALYLNNSAENGQVSFSLIFDEISLFTGLLREVFKWLGWLLICFFLFIIPGWAILMIAWPSFGKLAWLEKLGLGAGVSLALYPLLMLLMDKMNLKMGIFFTWIPMIIGIIIIVWQNRKLLPQLFSRKLRDHPINYSLLQRWALPWVGIGFLVLIISIFFVRFWAIRTIDVPMWGDSIQHTVMAQLIIDNKGLFNSWEPYAPYQSLTVQYGFSAHVALFSWITGLPSYTSALIVGQIINGLAILTLILLAYRYSPNNSWAVAATLIFAGLLIPMPAFYVNWGRFAQLDGQAILPVAIWMTCEFLEKNKRSLPDYYSTPINSKTVSTNGSSVFSLYGLKCFWIPGFLIGAVIVGMILCYYRMAFYYLCFFLAWIFYMVLSRRLINIREWISIIFRILVIGGISLVLFMPWLFQVVGSSLSGMVYSGMIDTKEQISVLEELMSWKDINTYLPYRIIVVVVVAFLWSFVRKRWDVMALVLWAGLLQMYFLGQLIQLPGAIMLQVFAIQIWLYMPASLISGWLIGEIYAKILHRAINLERTALVLILIILALYGANKTRLISSPDIHSLVTRPDMRAMEWIDQKIPSNAKFLVGAFRYNKGFTTIGSDAGWWIPLLARRQNTMPPQYALLFEVPKPPNQSRRINNLVFALYKVSPASPEGLQLLCNNKITHIYFGQKPIYFGSYARQLYSATDLVDNPNFDLLYHQDRVSIFSLNQTTCHQK